jgi:ABC-type sugar transport system permease subunit
LVSQPDRLRTERPQWAGWLWVLPALAILIFVQLAPVAQTAFYSFHDRTSFSAGHFVGLEEYRLTMGSDQFRAALINNLIFALSVPLVIAVALVFVAILYQGIRFTRLWEAMVFFPYLPAIASVSVALVYFLGENGPVNTMIRAVLGNGAGIHWLTQVGTASWTIMLILSWKRLGVTVLLFMARMVMLDRREFEAAALEGASWPTTFRRVALPQLRSIIQFAAIIGFVEVFAYAFSYIFILTHGGPQESTYTLEFLMYRLQFFLQNVGAAAVVAMVILSIMAVLGVARALVARHEGELV